MKTHANRIKTWLIMLAIAVVFLILPEFVDVSQIKIPNFDDMNKVKTEIYVNAPPDMEKAFNSALKSANLQKDYKITITDSDSASITIVEGGDNKDNYQRIAFSPIVCAMGYHVSESRLKKANILVKNQFDSKVFDFDISKVVNEVIEGGSWDSLSVRDTDLHKLGNIIVYYPDKSTSYWNDFYNFMLVNLNDGEYPKNETEMKSTEEKLQNFFDSKNAIAVVDFDERVQRNEGFTENAIYIIPENLILELSNEHSYYVDVFYPKYTVYYSYYISCVENDAVIDNIILNLPNGNFYNQLSKNGYRSNNMQNIKTIYSHVRNMRNIFNVINNLKLEDESENNETDSELDYDDAEE